MSSSGETSRRQRKGVVIALVGTLIATPDAVLVRWAQKEKAELSAIVFWELLVTGLIMYIFSKYETGKNWRALLRNPLLTLGLGISTASISILLSYAYVFTLAATAVLLFHLHPLWSGVMGWLCLGDVMPVRTALALLSALVALVIMFLPEIEGMGFGNGGIGDAMALACSFVLSSYLCLARYASRVDPELSTPLVSALAFVVTAALVVPVALLTGSTILLTPLSVPAVLMDGFVVGAVNVANSIAPIYATATQVGLIELTEAVLSPIWVYAIYREVPDLYTIGGGLAIIFILAAHELFDPDCLGGPQKMVEDDKEKDDKLSSLIVNS